MGKTAEQVAIIKRIEQKRLERGLTKTEFCKRLGITLSAYSNWTTERDNKSNSAGFTDKITEIAEVLECPLDYLLRGKVDMKADFIRVENVRHGVRPVLGSVSAGRGVIAQDDILGYESVAAEYDRDDTFWLRVFGDSMSPKIDNGDLVLVDRAAAVESGNIAVAVVDDSEGFVKKVELTENSIALISLNTNYPPMIFVNQEMQRVYIIGRVVKQERAL